MADPKMEKMFSIEQEKNTNEINHQFKIAKSDDASSDKNQYINQISGVSIGDSSNLDIIDDVHHEMISLIDKQVDQNVEVTESPLSLEASSEHSCLLETKFCKSIDDSSGVHTYEGDIAAESGMQCEGDARAIFVHITDGKDNEERSWNSIKSSIKNSPNTKSSRTNGVNIPISAMSAVEAFSHDRDRNLSGENPQIDSPFGYKNWLFYLAKRRRCEILILIGLVLWLAFFFVLAIVLNGNSSNSGTVSPTDDVTDKMPGLQNSSIQDEVSKATKIEDTHIFMSAEKGETSSQVNNNSKVTIQLTNHSPTTTLEDKSGDYLIGVGRADITGPAADVNMMGYANPSQVSGGIHMRQYARAFIIEGPKTKIRTVFVNIDACMASTLVKLEVLKQINAMYGSLYTAENLCISGTHTHSAPAGFLQDVLFQISSWGFVEETLTAMVNGIVESIKIAHESIQPGYILMNKGDLQDSNINRSPAAYLNNPAEERSRYLHDVDKDMTLLKFVDKNGVGIGMINWFPVHCTSMNNTNSLISGDNKGYAELLFEKYMDPESPPGSSKFVAAFAQSNEGDVSPNTKGPHCIDTGEKCDNVQSTCGNKVQNCIASGPGNDMFESTKIIGTNQFRKAKELFEAASQNIEGPVDYRQQYVDMTKYEVTLNETEKVVLCKPAMGFSFAAGTTDGPGAFDFTQGDKSGGNVFWKTVRNFLHSPSEEQIECHSPKPILLDTGEMTAPYEWQPNIVDIQLLRIGQFVLIAAPGEFSTMVGRRIRNAVLEILNISDGKTHYEAVIAGLANSYSDYITTFEEYQIQRYEGASTIYGPHTALAYEQIYSNLMSLMLKNASSPHSVLPSNNKEQLYSFQAGVIYDFPRSGYSMGDVVENVNSVYIAGEEVVVKFVAGNPRNSLPMQRNMTYLAVEKQVANGSWQLIHNDASWETKYIWKRTSSILGQSEVTITWNTDQHDSGVYRICHNGHYKYILGGIFPYSGCTTTFKVKSNE